MQERRIRWFSKGPCRVGMVAWRQQGPVPGAQPPSRLSRLCCVAVWNICLDNMDAPAVPAAPSQICGESPAFAKGAKQCFS